MEDKMRKWGMAPDAQARVMEYLTKNKFVDDERYARAFALDKIRYNKWGRRKVEQALWAKRIDEPTRQLVLGEIADALGRGFDYALIRRCIDVPDDIDEGYGGEFVE